MKLFLVKFLTLKIPFFFFFKGKAVDYACRKNVGIDLVVHILFLFYIAEREVYSYFYTLFVLLIFKL